MSTLARKWLTKMTKMAVLAKMAKMTQRARFSIVRNYFWGDLSPEREFPALLVVWGYQQKQLIFGRGQFIFARKREKFFLGVFFAFWGCFCAFRRCFCAFWGCFCAFWVFFCFSRASAIFFWELFF